MTDIFAKMASITRPKAKKTAGSGSASSSSGNPKKRKYSRVGLLTDREAAIIPKNSVINYLQTDEALDGTKPDGRLLRFVTLVNSTSFKDRPLNRYFEMASGEPKMHMSHFSAKGGAKLDIPKILMGNSTADTAAAAAAPTTKIAPIPPLIHLERVKIAQFVMDSFCNVGSPANIALYRAKTVFYRLSNRQFDADEEVKFFSSALSGPAGPDSGLNPKKKALLDFIKGRITCGQVLLFVWFVYAVQNMMLGKSGVPLDRCASQISDDQSTDDDSDDAAAASFPEPDQHDDDELVSSITIKRIITQVHWALLCFYNAGVCNYIPALPRMCQKDLNNYLKISRHSTVPLIRSKGIKFTNRNHAFIKLVVSNPKYLFDFPADLQQAGTKFTQRIDRPASPTTTNDDDDDADGGHGDAADDNAPPAPKRTKLISTTSVSTTRYTEWAPAPAGPVNNQAQHIEVVTKLSKDLHDTRVSLTKMTRTAKMYKQKYTQTRTLLDDTTEAYQYGQQQLQQLQQDNDRLAYDLDSARDTSYRQAQQFSDLWNKYTVIKTLFDELQSRASTPTTGLAPTTEHTMIVDQSINPPHYIAGNDDHDREPIFSQDDTPLLVPRTPMAYPTCFQTPLNPLGDN